VTYRTESPSSQSAKESAGLHVPADLQAALHDLATAEHLTLNALVIRLIDEALGRRLKQARR